MKTTVKEVDTAVKQVDRELELEEYAPWKASDGPAVSIYKSKNMFLNQEAWEGLGSPSRVRLFYARNEKTVVIRPVPEDDLNSFSVNDQRGYYRVAARGFVSYFDIPHDRSKRYRANITTNGSDASPELSFSLNDEPIWISSR